MVDITKVGGTVEAEIHRTAELLVEIAGRDLPPNRMVADILFQLRATNRTDEKTLGKIIDILDDAQNRLDTSGELYLLEKQDISSVGGPMGTEKVRVIWTKYFNDWMLTKEAAERDHGDAITWSKTGNSWSSGDLRSHMYYIRCIQVEQRSG